jgi:hypothetical protein
MSTADALTTAQAIIDSVMDIRPSLKGKTVTRVERGPLTEPPTARVKFSDGSEVRFSGLYARQILKHLPTVL